MGESTDQAAIRCTAFNSANCVASGDLREVVVKVKAVLDADPSAHILIFNDLSGDLVDFDFRGTAAEIARRAESMAVPPTPPRGPGRPRLGVVAREVTLLPRHWDWLATQPGGASVALRRLVEEARRTSGGKDRVRRSQAAAYKFMVAMAGDAPGFEEATRALFAGNIGRFNMLVEPWPADVRDHARALATGAFPV